jgi:O-antigen ligase
MVFLVLFHDLVASRFLHLETPIEAHSLEHRQVDSELALQLIAEHPWSGVGVREYLVAVRAIEPNSRTVHNVFLLTAAELGLPGAGLWLWLSLTGLLSPVSAAWAPWITMMISGLFDVVLAPTNSWSAVSLFALLAAHTVYPSRAAPAFTGESGSQKEGVR